MDNTLKSVKAKVRSLVGDVMGDFTTDAYLTPLINQAYEDQTTELMADTDSSFDDWVFDVLGVPQGTTSLANYQASQMANEDGTKTNGPLYGLVTPICVEWKIGGQPDNCYVEANRTGKLPNISPATPSGPYQIEWEWRGNIIYMTPVTYTIDIRVRGEFSPPSLVNDTDILAIHPRMGTAVAYGTSALIGVERSNANFVTNYTAQAQKILDNISNMLTKGEQGTTTRIGRLHNSNRGWGGGFRG